jgi:hypothetical protein
VDFGAAFVADEQPLEVVQPRQGAPDDPAGAAEPGAVRNGSMPVRRDNAAVGRLRRVEPGQLGEYRRPQTPPFSASVARLVCAVA